MYMCVCVQRADTVLLQLVRSVLAEPRSNKLPGSLALAVVRRHQRSGMFISGGRYFLLIFR